MMMNRISEIVHYIINYVKIDFVRAPLRELSADILIIPKYFFYEDDLKKDHEHRSNYQLIIVSNLNTNAFPSAIFESYKSSFEKALSLNALTVPT